MKCSISITSARTLPHPRPGVCACCGTRPAAPPPDALLVLTDWRDGAPLALVCSAARP